MKSLSRRSNSEDCSGNEGFRVSLNQITRNVATIYLYGNIEDATQFIDAIEILTGLSENDVAVLKINSGGGDLDATDCLVAAMRNCPAHVVADIAGSCHSAATIIMLNADEVQISEHASFLFHNGGCGGMGKTSDVKAQMKHTLNYMERIMRSSYEGFFDDETIDAILEGKDVWLDRDGVMERLAQREEYFQALIDEAIADASEDSCPDCGNEECSCEPHEAVGATD